MAKGHHHGKNEKQKRSTKRDGYRYRYSQDKPASIKLVIYILPGTVRTVPGTSVNRIVEDLKRAIGIWRLPIEVVKLIETSTDFGLAHGKLQCNERFAQSSVFRAMENRREADGYPSEWITVWYVPNFRFSDNNTIACAYSNRIVGNRLYQHIIMSGRTAAQENRSTLAHELGHIFFATAPGENNSDPTSRNSPHSPISSNFMSTPAGNKTGIDIRQIQKACRSALVPECERGIYERFKN
ncbi:MULTISPECIES: hypothetical protein [unclassified Bacillus (in: firmicutes)]|uniref:hypothetical protein n=1 Tax=unclassified Bacillus (in: firmicutes) TaxID=185979 RepID=UPI0008E4F9FE|nr:MULTISPECIES: hypothetical protein [unclassified Bacillus (in: firmicutes)]SFB07920.1 hypothetical protein SAMN02799634_105134 [Bacillus sp. UNCCL13]SFQ87179.1 hypothetical protein SAMN04488577_2987 [Bacillus sp. cl95]